MIISIFDVILFLFMIMYDTTNHKNIITHKSQIKFIKLFETHLKFPFNKKLQNSKEFLSINDICPNQIKTQIMIKISNKTEIL